MMPLRSEAAPSPSVVRAVHAGSARRGRVLVIDDELPIGLSIRRVLATEHDVEVVTDGTEALAKIAGGARFDVILCDLSMPRIGGVEFRARLQDVEPGLVERTVFMTAGTFTRETSEFLKRISNTHIEKPFDVRQLREMVRARVAHDPQAS